VYTSTTAKPIKKSENYNMETDSTILLFKNNMLLLVILKEMLLFGTLSAQTIAFLLNFKLINRE